IRVKSQKPIIVSNADDIVDDTYIWHINLDNYENHGIIFTLQKNAQSDISRDDEEKKETVPTIYVVAILGAFVLFLGGIFIYNFHLRNSK
ncbi:MAG: hypothetical protein HFI09_04655, partial [Bacilli bacterium]|nr:hypothetical protein [Bacilli bacterium]